MSTTTSPDKDQHNGSNSPQRDGHPQGHGTGHDEGIPTDVKPASTALVVVLVLVFALLLGGLFLVGFIPSRNELRKIRAEAAERANAKPAVLWLRPGESNGEKDVVLPCDVDAYQQTAIYTRTSGYLRKWNYDIGQHVDAGKEMAFIETPEVDAELAQSKATLAQSQANVTKAEADLDLAKKTLARYVESQKNSPGSVTQEALDQQKSALQDAQAALEQMRASVVQSQANVQQLQVTVDFEHVTSPFSGTVTARNYDVGALLSPTTSREIFDLAETDKLRVFVNVPQGYANNIRQGQKAYLKVRNFPRNEFEGTVTLTAGAVDPNTRTLRVQIDFDNKEGKLFAGEYGQIRLPVTPQQSVAIIRSSSLIFNAAGTEVAVLGPDDKVHIKTITIGRDLGTELEVTSGLQPDDRVVVNPAEQTTEGAEVTAQEAPHDAPPAKPDTTQPATAPSTAPATQPSMATADAGSIVTGNTTR
jgi:RND family efflux transporter MFP subunit